jgi:hypothetical protein
MADPAGAFYCISFMRRGIIGLDNKNFNALLFDSLAHVIIIIASSNKEISKPML